MGPQKFYELTGYDLMIYDQARKSGYMDPASIASDGKNIVYNADKPAAVRVNPKIIDNAGVLNPTTRTITVTKTDGSAPTVLSPTIGDLRTTQAALQYAGLGNEANALTPAVADAQTPGSAPIQYSPGLALDQTPTIAPARSSTSGLLIGAAVVAAGLVGMSFLPKQPAAAAPVAPKAKKGAA